jgi:hypothetical protein
MSDDWTTYRTRFLVHAKQLTKPLSFTDPLGRQHNGVPGDYLVQSSEGMLRIAPREIFEDVYVRMEEPNVRLEEPNVGSHPARLRTDSASFTEGSQSLRI